MPRFLTPEWVDAVNGALAPLDLGAGITLTVGHLIRHPDGGETSYVLRVAGGRPTVAIGGVELLEDAHVVLIHDADTAAAIHRGDLSAQQAVEAGRLKLRGDTQKLIASAAALAPVREVVASVAT